MKANLSDSWNYICVALLWPTEEQYWMFVLMLPEISLAKLVEILRLWLCDPPSAVSIIFIVNSCLSLLNAVETGLLNILHFAFQV